MPLQVLITSLDYDDYIGRLALGRVISGTLAKGQDVVASLPDGEPKPLRISTLYGFEGLRRREIESASAGDLVAVAGFDDFTIGETLCRPRGPSPPATAQGR